MRPYRTTVAVYSVVRPHRLKTFTSGADGRFRVALAAGRYQLRGTHAGLPRLTPVDVTVRHHHFTGLTITFDSGIR